MCVILVQDVDSGGSCVCVVQGVYGNSLYFLLNFAVNLKVLYKMKLIKKHSQAHTNPAKLVGQQVLFDMWKTDNDRVKWRVRRHTAS